MPAGYDRSRVATADVLWMVGLMAGTVAYIAYLPRNLSPADESVYLYEAKRLLNGEVLYRDVFEITTPGWMYLVAVLFRIFGTDLATARMAVAVLHGLTAALLYLTCRRLRVRRGLCWPTAVAYLVICPPAWPIASQHWLTTSLTVLLLYVCADARPRRPSWALLPGLVIGLLIGVHQQRGICMGFGILAWLVLDHLRRRRYEGGRPRGLLVSMAWLAAGTALVMVPLGIDMIGGAGFAPVWQALVVHPLFSYPALNRCAWGHVSSLTADQASYTFPRLLKYLPLVLLVSIGRIVGLWLRRDAPDEARALGLLIMVCLASVLSIAYFPDFIHIAFIAPPFLVAAAESVEWAVRRIPAPARFLERSGRIAGLAFMAVCGMRLAHNLERSRAAYPFTRQTAFGRVDLATSTEAQLYDTVRQLVDHAPSRQLFCYPIISYLYLMADADNPTRYQFFFPGYSTPAQVQEVVATLRAKDVPYIVALSGFVPADDPIIAFVRRNYEPISPDTKIGAAVFRRKDGDPDARGVADRNR